MTQETDWKCGQIATRDGKVNCERDKVMDQALSGKYKRSRSPLREALHLKYPALSALALSNLPKIGCQQPM
ncbi:hypothetical protein ACHWQZ_G003890 [Mnemiopsis leidyi]